MPLHENPRPARSSAWQQPDWSQREIEWATEPDSPTGADRTAPMLLKIPAVARALSIGRTKTYELIAKGELEVVHIDGSARVPVDSLRSYVERLRAEVAERKPRSRGVRVVEFGSSPPGDSQPPAA